MIVSGWLRSVFPLGLALTGPGVPGLVTVIVVETLLIISMGVFNPISATERRDHRLRHPAARHPAPAARPDAHAGPERAGRAAPDR